MFGNHQDVMDSIKLNTIEEAIEAIPQNHEFHITIYHEYATFIVLLMSMVLTADLRSLRVTDFVTEYRMLIH